MQIKKIAVLTGAAWGIGRCLLEQYCAADYRVYFIDKEGEAVAQREAEMHARGYDCRGFVGDIANPDALRTLAQEVLLVEEQGIDCLINNACLTRRGILSGCSYDDFLYVQQVGVAAPYLLALLFKNHFKQGASILNISSSRAFQSQADTESYSAAKGGITALTHALAVSLAGVVRVNAIAPGWIDTGSYYDPNYQSENSEADSLQHPSGRIGNPMDIARTALFLCDSRNSFINGQTLTVDGGMGKLMVYHNDMGWSYEPPTAK